MASALVLKAFSVAVVAGLESGFGVVLVGLFLGGAREPRQLLRRQRLARGARPRPPHPRPRRPPHRRVRQGRHPEGLGLPCSSASSSSAAPRSSSSPCSRPSRSPCTNPYALGLLTLLAIYGILLIGLDVTVGLPRAGEPRPGGLPRHRRLRRRHPRDRRSAPGSPCALVAAAGVVHSCSAGSSRCRRSASRGPQFALATLSFTALATTALNELEGLTGGAQGLSLIAPAALRARALAARASTGSAWPSWRWSGWRCATCSRRSGGGRSRRSATAPSPPTPWASAPTGTRWPPSPSAPASAASPARSTPSTSSTCSRRASSTS